MALEFGPLTFANPVGLWGLSALIPLILLYLIRPRPLKMEIPSLMFFLNQKENPRQQQFFRRITKDWLFLLQLLILLLLALHLAEPLTKYQHDITAENTVIVLDVSGSSQVYEGRQTRFEKGIQFAMDALGGKNTLILAKGGPKIVGVDLSYQDAMDTLRGTLPSASTSAIGDSMVLAGETLNGREGRVVVISDFINTVGIDPNTARAVLMSKGLVVDMISTIEGQRKRNVGIVNMEVDDESVTIFVKNFNEREEKATVVAGSFRKDITVGSQSTETVSFETPKENLKVELLVEDDFPLDNTAYIATPKSQKIRVLLISNNESVFVRNALTTLSEVELEFAEPPIVPTSKYDIYVIHQVQPGNVLPGTFESIEEHVSEGSNLIIAAQKDMDQMNYKNLLPVTIGERAGHGVLQVEQTNTFTRDLTFGGLDQYWKTGNLKGTVSIVSDGFNSSVIAFQQRGAGKILYFGIEEQASDFKVSPSYPIFWAKLLRFMVGQDTVSNLNVKTGTTAILEAVQSIKTPAGSVKQNVLVYEYSGLYEFEHKVIAANLLDQDESQINAVEQSSAAVKREVELRPVREEREFSFEIPIALTVLGLLFLELVYIKWRGDL